MADNTSKSQQSNPTNLTLDDLRDQVALVHFVDELILERGDSRVNMENLPTIREALLSELNDQINSHLVGLLNEEQQKELSDLLDKEAPDKDLDDFFVRSVSNIEGEIATVLLNFRTAYLAPVFEEQAEEFKKEKSSPANSEMSQVHNPSPTPNQAESKPQTDNNTQDILKSLEKLAQDASSVANSSADDDFMPAPPAPVEHTPSRPAPAPAGKVN